MKQWNVLKKELVKDFNFFKVFREKYINPRNLKEVYFYHLELLDWTVIVPVIDGDKLLMIKQFRPGAKKFFLEFPGGLIHKNEKPESAAKRELLEETGYSCNDLKLLNVSYPLPAFQTSKCYIFCAEKLKKENERLNLDDGEDIEPVIIDFERAKKLLFENKIDNSIMAFALSLYILKREEYGN